MCWPCRIDFGEMKQRTLFETSLYHVICPDDQVEIDERTVGVDYAVAEQRNVCVGMSLAVMNDE